MSGTRASAYEDVARQMRRRIVAGDWKPGSKLPTWDSMALEFSVARPTLMRAMERLRRDGFIYAKSTRGTYVSERSPHLCRYGLVFPTHPGQGPLWNRFWDTITAQTPVIEREFGIQLPTFFDVCDSATDGYARLERQLDDQRLGGLILVGRPDLLNLSIIQESKLPCVLIYGGVELADKPRVWINQQSFIDQSLDYLISRGARRIAVLSNNTDRWSGFDQAIAARNVYSKPFWRLSGAGEGVVPLVRLLFDPDSSTHPDGLVIADDNIVEYAIEGLLHAGVAVPRQLSVVAHCNWPAPIRSPLPLCRLGYDVNEILSRCINTILACRDGQNVDRVQLVPARQETEEGRENAVETSSTAHLPGVAGQTIESGSM